MLTSEETLETYGQNKNTECTWHLGEIENSLLNLGLREQYLQHVNCVQITEDFECRTNESEDSHQSVMLTGG